MNHFQELSLCPVLQGNLARLGFTRPTPVQAQAIPPALEGRDVVATAQTGTGKTLAFSLPLLHRMQTETAKPGVQAVILSPTRELAMQIDEAVQPLAQGTGLRTALVVGGMNEARQIQQLRQGVAIVVATPGRLCDFLQRGLVNLGGVRHLVLDEADRMLDMGFLPSLDQIIRALPAGRQTLFFSATMEPAVTHLTGKYLRTPVRVAIGATTCTADRVELRLYEVPGDRKLGLLHHLTRNEPGATLVFARTKHGAERLARKLERLGVRSAAIHGGRTQAQRNRALAEFRAGRHHVLVATDVAARGLHVDGVAHVVNYDLPQAPEDFIHRVGRTGRAGHSGVATTFCTPAERQEVRRIERTLQASLIRIALPGDLPREAGAAAGIAGNTVVVLPVNRPAKVVFRSGRRRRA